MEHLPKIHSFSILMHAVVFLVCLDVSRAAEITGTVSVDYKGLFEPRSSGHTHPISVALLPVDGQEISLRETKIERIEIVENRMVPSFLTIQQGDRVEFVNREPVFHQLFSLSQEQPLTVRLDRSGTPGKDQVAVKLDQPGVTHFFCRIHNKSYARIDVIASPYLQTIQAGQTFHFSGLKPGPWKLRLASPAAETRIVEVTALTSPPPLQLKLASHDGGAGRDRLTSRSGVEQLYKTNSR